MKIFSKDLYGTQRLEGTIIASTRTTVTIRLDSPMSGRCGTFPTPINRRTLEHTIPFAEWGLRTLYEEEQAKESNYKHHRFILMSPIVDDSDVDSHLDQAHELSRALTIKYLSQCGHSPLMQRIIETFKSLPNVRLTLDYTLEPGSRLISTIGFRIVENDTVREHLQGNTTDKYDFTPMLEDYFVRQLGYPAVTTRTPEETQQFITKLFEAAPLSRTYLHLVRIPEERYDSRWYSIHEASSQLPPWHIEKQYGSTLLRARILHFGEHHLCAALEDHALRLESHIFDPHHIWGEYGKYNATLLLDRFYQILERVKTEGNHILKEYRQRRHEVQAMEEEMSTLPAYDDEAYDQRCAKRKIEIWYNHLLLPYIFYPVHNGEEIIRYLQSQQREEHKE